MSSVPLALIEAEQIFGLYRVHASSAEERGGLHPSDEAMEAAERDEIVLAGCMVGDLDPSYYCRRCLIALRR